ncbi:MAG: 50S ribosomal protein L1 [Planctomycetota bacterium]
MKTSKRHTGNLATRSSEAVEVDKGVEMVQRFQGARFDETVEIAIRTGIDPRQTAQSLRGAFSLPHGIGKKVRVIAFCEGEDAQKAQGAGAIEVGAQELAKKIQDGWLEFDVAVAHPSMMRHVGKLGRILGPQGKMPSPKAGTVTTEVGRVVAEFVAGKIEFRNDSGGIIHAPMGLRSFSREQLVENIRSFVGHITSLKPAAAKGVFIRKIFIKSTMSPSVPIVPGS